jgi:hypothetical protein
VTHLVDGDLREAKPWAECLRDIKLRTLEELPLLIEDLHQKVKMQIAQVQAKVELLDGMIPSESELQRPSAKKKA